MGCSGREEFRKIVGRMEFVGLVIFECIFLGVRVYKFFRGFYFRGELLGNRVGIFFIF